VKEEFGEERPEVAKVKQVQDEITIEISLRLESNNVLAQVLDGPGHQAGCVVKCFIRFKV